MEGAVAVITCSLSAADVLALKFASPPYAAVIEWLPKVSIEVLKGAEPEVSAPGPSGVVPSLKVRLPVGVPALRYCGHRCGERHVPPVIRGIGGGCERDCRGRLVDDLGKRRRCAAT